MMMSLNTTQTPQGFTVTSAYINGVEFNVTGQLEYGPNDSEIVVTLTDNGLELHALATKRVTWWHYALEIIGGALARLGSRVKLS